MAPEEHRIWRPSPSPEETWSDASGANEDGEWPVKAVVGEEYPPSQPGSTDMKCVVRWGNWYRRDGSNTTWETEKFERPELIRRWNRTQKRLRSSRADEDLNMRVPWPDDAVHKRLTNHRQQAYEEKLERMHRANPTSTTDWDAEIEASYGRLQEPERGEANSKLRVRRAPTFTAGPSTSVPAAHPPSSRRSKISSPALTAPRDQSISSGPSSRRGRPRIDSEPSPSPRSAVATPSTSMRKGKVPMTPSSAGPSRDLEIARNTLPSVIVSQPTLRGRISSTWNKAAKEAMAAAVRISPSISDDKLPPNLRKFKYLEKGYVFRDEDLEDTFNVSRGVFTKCDCTTCSDASSCSCRDLSKTYDLGDETNLSVYSKGLFTFEVPRGVDVIECNKYCECSQHCGNRVAQRSRNISVEIFDTKRCGWGVRALDNILRGKVLGTYTGMLIRREEVNELPEEHQGYIFDLDSMEVEQSENLGGKYSVDSYEYGNWTRFVNHSCSPNTEVYCVVYDTIPYVNMPYVAFVASVDIEAGTELTIDYHPYAEKDKKGKRRATGELCRCGSEFCRGWMYK